LAAQFPDPLFIDCEGGTDSYDVARFPAPTSWEQLLDEVRQVIADPTVCGTLVIDTIDWAEAQAIRSICAKYQNSSIEDFGWSKGYTYLNEEMGRLLNLLTEVRDKGINVVLTAHMALRTVTQPDDTGAYDRYELKLKTAKNGNNSQMVKEWADMVLFLNWKQFVVEDSKTGKKKATGGRERVMYANHTASFDAKNRFNLPDELPLSFQSIAHLFGDRTEKKVKDTFGAENVKVIDDRPKPEPTPAPVQPQKPAASTEFDQLQKVWKPVDYTPDEIAEMAKLPKALQDLMNANYVHPEEIQFVTSQKGYFPKDQPVSTYPKDFIEGCLIGAWNSVFETIKKERELPF